MGLQGRRARHAAETLTPDRLTDTQAARRHQLLHELHLCHLYRVALDERESAVVDELRLLVGAVDDRV